MKTQLIKAFSPSDVYGLLICVFGSFDYVRVVMCVFMLLFHLLTAASLVINT